MDWPMAAAIAQKGLVTVCAEYRLSMEAPYPAAITDLKTAIRRIRKKVRNREPIPPVLPWWAPRRADNWLPSSEHSTKKTACSR